MSDVILLSKEQRAEELAKALQSFDPSTSESNRVTPQVVDTFSQNVPNNVPSNITDNPPVILLTPEQRAEELKNATFIEGTPLEKPRIDFSKSLEFTESLNAAQQANIDFNEIVQKTQRAEFYARATGMDFDVVYQNYEAYNKAYESKPDVGDGWDALETSISYGQQNIRLGQLRFNQMTGGDSPELRQRIAELILSMPDPQEIEDKLPMFINATAQLLPQLVETGYQGAVVAAETAALFAGGAALAGQTGPLIAVPEEVVTVPAAAISGFGVGFRLGSGKAMFEMEAGLMYDTLHRAGIPDDIAIPASLGTGAINSLIEQFQLSKILPLFPALSKMGVGVTQDAINKALSEAMKSGVARKAIIAMATNVAKTYGGAVATNTLEEIAQEAVSIIFETASDRAVQARALRDPSLAVDTDSGLGVSGIDDPALWERLKQTAITSMAAMSVLSAKSLATSVHQNYSQYIQEKRQQENIAETEVRTGNIQTLDDMIRLGIDAFGIEADEAVAIDALMRARAKALDIDVDEFTRNSIQDISKTTEAEFRIARDNGDLTQEEPLAQDFVRTQVTTQQALETPTPKFTINAESMIQAAADLGIETDYTGTDIFEWAKIVKGVTEDQREAGYILPDGTLLDFSGKNEGAEGGERIQDHRELPLENNEGLANTDIMVAFQKEGAVRMDWQSGSADMEVKPTPAQKEQIELMMIDRGGGQLDMFDGDRRASVEIDNVDRVNNTIDRFYRGQEVPTQLFQDAETSSKGVVQFMNDGKAIITAFENADVSTMVHEIGHVFRRQLNPTQVVQANEFVGAKEGERWTREQEEQWARGFEDYLQTGIAPTLELSSTFEKFKQWLTDIYGNIKEVLSPQASRVYDSLFLPPVSERQEKVVQSAQLTPTEEFKAKQAEQGRPQIRAEREVQPNLERSDVLAEQGTLTEEEFALTQLEEGEIVEGYNDRQYFAETERRNFINEVTLTNQDLGRWASKIEKARIFTGNKGIDFSIVAAAKKFEATGEVTPRTENILRKSIQNNPDKYRILDAAAEEDVPRAKRISDGIEVEGFESTAEPRVIDSSQALREEMARAVKPGRGAAKAQARILSNQRKLDNMVSEREALISKLTAEARAAKKAGSEGKKEGTATERARNSALRKAKREAKVLKDYLRDTAEKIHRPPSKNISADYGQAIKNIQALLDPNFRRESFINRRKALERFLKDNPDAAKLISNKTYRKIKPGTKSLGELNFGEIEQMVEDIENLKQLGRLKKQLKDKARARSIIRVQNSIVGNLSSQSTEEFDKQTRINRLKLKPANDINAPGEPFFATLHGIHAMALRPNRNMDILDTYQNFQGSIHDYMINETNKNEDEKIINKNKRLDTVLEVFKENDVLPASLAETRPFRDENVQVQDLMAIYFGWENEHNRKALEGFFKITEQEREMIGNDILTPGELAAGEAMMEDMEVNFDRIAEAVLSTENEILEKQDFYMRMKRESEDFEERDTKTELLQSLALDKAFVGKDFTIARKDINMENQTRIKLNMYENWMDSVELQEQYIAHAQHVKDMHRVISSPDVKLAVKEKLGQRTNTQLLKYVNNVGNPRLEDGSSKEINRWARFFRKNLAASVLALNVVTALKQVPSIFYFMGDAGLDNIMKSTAKFWSNPSEFIANIESIVPQIKERSIEREIDEFKRQAKLTGDNKALRQIQKFENIRNKIAAKGFFMIEKLDKMTVAIGFDAVYNRRIKEGMSDSGAYQEALNSMLRTQPAGARKDLPGLYTSNEVVNMMLQFTNQLNQIFNILTVDLRSKIKTGNSGDALLQLAGLGIGAMGIFFANNLRFPEDDEDWKKFLLDQAAIIPLFGRTVVSTAQGYGPSALTPFESLAKALSVFSLESVGGTAKERKTAEEKNLKKIVRAFEGIAQATGIPYLQPKRIYTAIEEEDWLEIFGGRE